MGIIEKKALKKRLEGREAHVWKESRKGNKVQLLGTWKLSHLDSGSVFHQIWGEVGALHLKGVCETCMSKL